MELFNNPDQLADNLKSKIMALKKNIYHKLHYQNKRPYSVNNDTVITSCMDLPESYIRRIKGHGIIEISDFNCR